MTREEPILCKLGIEELNNPTHSGSGTFRYLIEVGEASFLNLPVGLSKKKSRDRERKLTWEHDLFLVVSYFPFFYYPTT